MGLFNSPMGPIARRTRARLMRRTAENASSEPQLAAPAEQTALVEQTTATEPVCIMQQQAAPVISPVCSSSDAGRGTCHTLTAKPAVLLFPQPQRSSSPVQEEDSNAPEKTISAPPPSQPTDRDVQAALAARARLQGEVRLVSSFFRGSPRTSIGLPSLFRIDAGHGESWSRLRNGDVWQQAAPSGEAAAAEAAARLPTGPEPIIADVDYPAAADLAPLDDPQQQLKVRPLLNAQRIVI